MQGINHITLQTGHNRESPRNEISEEVLSVCKELITSMLLNPEKKPPVPNCEGYFVNGGSIPSNPRKPGLYMTVWKGELPLVTIVVNVDESSSKKHWRDLHRGSVLPPITNPAKPPPTPWVAASLTDLFVAYPDALVWLGDFERCIAWAWWDYLFGEEQ